MVLPGPEHKGLEVWVEIDVASEEGDHVREGYIPGVNHLLEAITKVIDLVKHTPHSGGASGGAEAILISN